MTSTTFFIIFIPISSLVLLFVNLILAPHYLYPLKHKVTNFKISVIPFSKANTEMTENIRNIVEFAQGSEELTEGSVKYIIENSIYYLDTIILIIAIVIFVYLCIYLSRYKDNYRLSLKKTQMKKGIIVCFIFRLLFVLPVIIFSNLLDMPYLL
jgi:ABC-type phosphate transport system permease subunit